MQQGVVALSSYGAGPVEDDIRAVLRELGTGPVTVEHGPGLVIATWGLPRPVDGRAVLLSGGQRRHERDLDAAEVGRLLDAGDVAGLAQVLPPFAAFRQVDESTVVATADALGFRHLYVHQGRDWGAFSTSASVLGVLAGAGVDRDALAVQSLLGWQVGQATLFDRVTKLPPGALLRVGDGRCDVVEAPSQARPQVGLEEAVHSAAGMLRDHLTAYVTDHPDTTLQLTGGQDSRILLSAIPRELRRGLTAITLHVPGSPDAEIAAGLARRTGMVHRVAELESLADMDPAAAYDLCLESSSRLERMADPIALAALTLAERHFDQGHRISGLGGEVARGFYYVGGPRNPAVTRQRVARLAGWRMFVNEAVEPDALVSSFLEQAREVAVDRVYGVMAGTGRDWLSATDDFYIEQRMQRWAGVTDTAVCFDRAMVNPMLDDRFISIARAMDPRSKRNSLFLAQLQMALDPELGSVPLDGRPAPVAYARPSVTNRLRAASSSGRKAFHKASQRVVGGHRPPAGGEVLAAKVVEHWRSNPQLLDTARDHDVLDPGWLGAVLAGERDPAPSTVSFMLNLTAAPSSIDRVAPTDNS